MTKLSTIMADRIQMWGRTNRIGRADQISTAEMRPLSDLDPEALAEIKQVQRLAATVVEETEVEDEPRFGM